MVQSAEARERDGQFGAGHVALRTRSQMERDRAGALHHVAHGLRDWAARERDTSFEQGGYSIRLVSRARKLRFDRHGPAPGHGAA
jgi:hypothetical protein